MGQCSNSGKRKLSDEVRQQLFDTEGNFVAKNFDGKGLQQGRRAVGYVEDRNYKLYFKLLPELPGIESQVDELGYRLFGNVTPQTELFKIITILIKRQFDHHIE